MIEVGRDVRCGRGSGRGADAQPGTMRTGFARAGVVIAVSVLCVGSGLAVCDWLVPRNAPDRKVGCDENGRKLLIHQLDFTLEDRLVPDGSYSEVIPELSGVHLMGPWRKTNFQTGRFIDCDFAGADLRGTRFRAAYFRASDLSGARLEGADFAGATYDGRTRWPTGFDPEARGARRVE
jgi:hypothetical protein